MPNRGKDFVSEKVQIDILGLNFKFGCQISMVFTLLVKLHRY